MIIRKERMLSLLLFLCICTVITRYPGVVAFRWTTKPARAVTSLFATYKVTIQHHGVEKVLDVKDNCSILEACLDAGLDMPHDCKLGVCLTCPSKVVSGKIDQSEGTLDDSVIEQGYALTCVSYPRSDVVVKSIEEDELVNAQFKR